MIQAIRKSLNNQHARDEFVAKHLAAVPRGATLLDAGCGSQRYRSQCGHLTYKGQDFGQYSTDERKALGTDGVGGKAGYDYGQLDYVGNIWDINEKDEAFDAILCTEVFEHIAYPNETVKEFGRLLKPGGTLILTAPSNCLRHMDPYFFYTGFSDRWYEEILRDNNFEIDLIQPVEDYYRWMAVEVARTMRSNSPLSWLLLAPAFLYFFAKKATQRSRDTMCMGYHVLARKRAR